jgi:hypothetical protein
MTDLTKAEEQVMHALWKLEKAFVKDVIEEFPEPKPAYNTVSTHYPNFGEEGICVLQSVRENASVFPHRFQGRLHETHS